MRSYIFIFAMLFSQVCLGADDRKIDLGFAEWKDMASAPASPGAGYHRTYFLSSDGNFYWKNSAGTAKKILLSGDLVNADVNASAAIAYSKLDLAASIVNADIAVGAAIAYSKLNLSTSIVNADVAAGAAVAYSKLALSNSIVTGDLTANSVTNAKMATMANATTKCRTTAGTGDPEDCTAAQMNAITGKEPLVLEHETTPANPASGFVKVYAKSDDSLYVLDSSGTETEIGAGGGGGTPENCSIERNTPNGVGSTATRIRTYSVEVAVGSCGLTSTSDAVNGDKITIGSDGYYCVYTVDLRSGGAARYGVSLNSAQLTTALSGITTASTIVECYAGSSEKNACSACRFFTATDIIRPHGDGSALDSTSDHAKIRVNKIF